MHLLKQIGSTYLYDNKQHISSYSIWQPWGYYNYYIVPQYLYYLYYDKRKNIFSNQVNCGQGWPDIF